MCNTKTLIQMFYIIMVNGQLWACETEVLMLCMSTVVVALASVRVSERRCVSVNCLCCPC